MYHLCVDQRKLFTWFRLSVIKFLFVYVQISSASGLRERYVRSCRFYDRYYKMRRIISPWEDNNCPYFTRRWGNRPKCMLNVDLANWTSKSDVKCIVLCPVHNIQMEIFVIVRFWVSQIIGTSSVWHINLSINLYIYIYIYIYIYSKTCLKRNLKGPEHFSAKARFPFNQGTLHTV